MFICLSAGSRVILGNNHVFRFNHPVQGMSYYIILLYVIIVCALLAREMKQKNHQKYTGGLYNLNLELKNYCVVFKCLVTVSSSHSKCLLDNVSGGHSFM